MSGEVEKNDEVKLEMVEVHQRTSSQALVPNGDETIPTKPKKRSVTAWPQTAIVVITVFIVECKFCYMIISFHHFSTDFGKDRKKMKMEMKNPNLHQLQCEN